jgi:GTP-binding protein HflX
LREIVRRPRPDPALYLGSGAAERLGAQFEEEEISLVIFDHAISAVQQRNLERLWKIRVSDRTELIIDIFSQRARSSEGKLQVELAQLQHQSSRLVRMWSHLERQRGGIGLRGGPGETQLELDRRMIEDKIKRLRVKLHKVERQRRTRRRARQRSDALRVSLIGYTNAGKSTLFNHLTSGGAVAVDQLFATLDPLTRRARLEDGQEIVVSDTVGFIRDLPHGLVAAFRATLEETAEADLLLHVVDSSSPDRDEQMAAVNKVLEEIGAGDVEQIVVFNKVDLTAAATGARTDSYGRIAGLAISAQSGAGVPELKQLLMDRARRGPPEQAGWEGRQPAGGSAFADDFSGPDGPAPDAGHVSGGSDSYGYLDDEPETDERDVEPGQAAAPDSGGSDNSPVERRGIGAAAEPDSQDSNPDTN